MYLVSPVDDYFRVFLGVEKRLLVSIMELIIWIEYLNLTSGEKNDSCSSMVKENF